MAGAPRPVLPHGPCPAPGQEATDHPLDPARAVEDGVHRVPDARGPVEALHLAAHKRARACGSVTRASSEIGSVT